MTMSWGEMDNAQLIVMLVAIRRLIALMEKHDTESLLWDELNQRYCAFELEARFRGLDKYPDTKKRNDPFEKFIETLDLSDDDQETKI